jgi:hypothetical protein
VNLRSATVVMMLAGVVTELPAQAHTHEEIGFRPPSFVDVTAPSVTGNYVGAEWPEAVVVATSVSQTAQFAEVVPARTSRPYGFAEARRPRLTRRASLAYRNACRSAATRKTVPRA